MGELYWHHRRRLQRNVVRAGVARTPNAGEGRTEPANAAERGTCVASQTGLRNMVSSRDPIVDPQVASVEWAPPPAVFARQRLAVMALCSNCLLAAAYVPVSRRSNQSPTCRLLPRQNVSKGNGPRNGSVAVRASRAESGATSVPP